MSLWEPYLVHCFHPYSLTGHSIAAVVCEEGEAEAIRMLINHLNFTNHYSEDYLKDCLFAAVKVDSQIYGRAFWSAGIHALRCTNCDDYNYHIPQRS